MKFKHTSVICDHPRSISDDLRSQKGSAMTEFVFVMPVLAIIFMIMFQLYLLCNAKHKVIECSRYATYEKAFSSKTNAAIQNEIETMILSAEPNLTLKNVEFTVTDSWKRSESRFAGPLGNILDNILGFFNGLFQLFPTLDVRTIYFDPVFTTAMFLGIPGTDIDLGLINALGVEEKNKVKARVTCDFEMEYLSTINELGEFLGGEKMSISPITLVDSLIIIHDDWAASSRKEFANRVGVAYSKDDFLDSLSEWGDGDLSSLIRGLWLYPVGGVIGEAFSAINIIYGTMQPILDIISTAGDIFGIESHFNDPIDPRGHYFKDNNAPDFAN